jgi:hypothetical protein
MLRYQVEITLVFAEREKSDTSPCLLPPPPSPPPPPPPPQRRRWKGERKKEKKREMGGFDTCNSIVKSNRTVSIQLSNRTVCRLIKAIQESIFAPPPPRLAGLVISGELGERTPGAADFG